MCVCEASLIIPHQNLKEKKPERGGGPHIRPLYHTMFLIYQSSVGGKNKYKRKNKTRRSSLIRSHPILSRPNADTS